MSVNAESPQLAPINVRAAAPAELPPLPAVDGVTWRALTPDDIPAWFRLRTDIEAHDDAIERTAEHELTEIFEGGWRDPEHDFIGGFDGDGRMWAWARVELRPVTQGTLSPSLLGGVHPDLRRRGIGSALVAWTEARARQKLAALDSTLPAHLRVFVDQHVAADCALAERMGFVPTRWYVNMRRDLSEPLPDAAPADVRIVPYTRERDEDVRITHNESFAVDHWGSSPIDREVWTLEVVGTHDFRPDWSFLAVDAETGRVVGYLLSGAYEQDWAPQGYTEGWTDLVGVRREYRGRGIAGALLTAAMRAYARDGMEYAGLDVDTDNPTGALGVYTRLGYVRERSNVLYTKDI